LDQRENDCCGPTTECGLTKADAVASQAIPNAPAGLDSGGAGWLATVYPAGVELIVLLYRLVGTERFLRR